DEAGAALAPLHAGPGADPRLDREHGALLERGQRRRIAEGRGADVAVLRHPEEAGRGLRRELRAVHGDLEALDHDLLELLVEDEELQRHRLLRVTLLQL